MAKTRKQPHLLLHNLLTALSYWGTTTRVMLVGFILLVASLLTAADSSLDMTFFEHFQLFTYIVGSLLLLDAGYVTISRSQPVSTKSLDKLLFLTFFAALSLLIILPYFATVPGELSVSTRWVLLVALFVLSLRLVVGLFFGSKSEK